MVCRICAGPTRRILDLGNQPIANNLLTSLDDSEGTHPLIFSWCDACDFGQVNDLHSGVIFNNSYPYFSSISRGYVNQCAHWARGYIEKFNPQSVLEIGCNDGYLLNNFKHLDHLGVDPSEGPILKAKELGLNLAWKFYDADTTDKKFDLIIANNVIAHTSDLHEFVGAMEKNLSDNGRISIELPPVETMIENNYYDTIYHEHYSYFSVRSIERLFDLYGLYIERIEKVTSHGGSYRIYITRCRPHLPMARTEIDIKKLESAAFESKLNSLEALLRLKQLGEKIFAFGAAAKGNTFLNYLGIKNDIIDFCVDETPSKIGKFLPGSRIPIIDMQTMRTLRPDVLYILPWNFKSEIMEKTAFISSWSGRHMCRE